MKQDQTQLNSVSCYLLPPGKLSDASWDGLRESAKIIQTRLGGLEILQNTEDAQLVQTVVRQQVAQMLCDTGAAPESLTKKMMEMVCCKT